MLERVSLGVTHDPALITLGSQASLTQQGVIARLTQCEVALGLYVVLHQFGDALTEALIAQIIGALQLVTDHAVTAHVVRGFGANMPDIVKERRQHHFIVIPLRQRQLCGLGHVLDLRHRFADVIVSTILLIQAKYLFNHLLRVPHHSSSSIRAMLASAMAGPTLIPTPVCISAAFRPGATLNHVKGLAPLAP